jgi:hypothetical protein
LLAAQVDGVEELPAVNTVGCVMVNDCVIVHRLASRIVQVYVPAHKAVADEPVPPLGAHEYV